jgi:hypothetical protein
MSEHMGGVNRESLAAVAEYRDVDEGQDLYDIVRQERDVLASQVIRTLS